METVTLPREPTRGGGHPNNGQPMTGGSYALLDPHDGLLAVPLPPAGLCLELLPGNLEHGLEVSVRQQILARKTKQRTQTGTPWLV